MTGSQACHENPTLVPALPRCACIGACRHRVCCAGSCCLKCCRSAAVPDSTQILDGKGRLPFSGYRITLLSLWRIGGCAAAVVRSFDGCHTRVTAAVVRACDDRRTVRFMLCKGEQRPKRAIVRRAFYGFGTSKLMVIKCPNMVFKH